MAGIPEIPSVWRRRAAIVAGPAIFLALLFGFDPVPEQPAVGRTLAVAALLAVYWLTEALPVAATALLPVVLLPLLGIMDVANVASAYMNDLIFLFLGGFLLAIAMQEWGLHRRVALGRQGRKRSAPRARAVRRRRAPARRP